MDKSFNPDDKPTFTGIIMEADLDLFMKAVGEIGLCKDDMFLFKDPIDNTGLILTDHYAVYSEKPNKSKELWNKFEEFVKFREYDNEKNLKVEIEKLTGE